MMPIEMHALTKHDKHANNKGGRNNPKFAYKKNDIVLVLIEHDYHLATNYIHH